MVTKSGSQTHRNARGGARRVNNRRPTDVVYPKGTISVPRNALTAFPDVFDTQLRFFSTYSLDATTGSIAWTKWRVNGPYDPDYATGGGQPRFWDQMAAIYGRYAVYRSHLKFEASSNQSSLPVYLVSGVFNNESFASTITNITDVVETRSCQTRLLNIGANRTAATINETWHINSLGVSLSDAMASDRYSATVTTSPSDVVLFGAGVAAQYSSDDPQSQVVHVTLVYDVLFYRPSYVAASAATTVTRHRTR